MEVEYIIYTDVETRLKDMKKGVAPGINEVHGHEGHEEGGSTRY